VLTELIDVLRCPNLHEDSWLVATSTRTESRHIVEGRLGCPVCKATFDIREGEVLFTSGTVLRATRVLDDESAFRLAAQLHLVDAPQPILLIGSWSRAVAPLRRIVPNVTMFVGDSVTVLAPDERVSLLRMPLHTLPLATGSVRGVALDAAHASADHLASAARIVAASGRLVAPAGTVMDQATWRVLASDTDVIVAERLAISSAPIQLKRAPSVPLFDG
jgi:uncharacterized protein YbaR (Trm112 family)